MHHCTAEISNLSRQTPANSTRRPLRNERIHAAYRLSTLRQVKQRRGSRARLVFGEHLPQPPVAASQRRKDSSATRPCMQRKMSARTSRMSCNPNLRKTHAGSHRRLAGRTKKTARLDRCSLCLGRESGWRDQRGRLTLELRAESTRPEARTRPYRRQSLPRTSSVRPPSPPHARVARRPCETRLALSGVPVDA